MLSIMALMCPSFDRGTWDMVSFSHMKAYGQSMLLSATSTSLQASSSRVWKWAWQGCPHTAARPKTLLHTTVRLGTIKRNTMSHWGFPTSPHAPAGEMVFSCTCMIACTWKLSTTRQMLCDPHFAFVAGSHKLVSAERGSKITHSDLQ